MVKAWLAEHAEIVVEDFPGYAPTLNPDEWVWSWTIWPVEQSGGLE